MKAMISSRTIGSILGMSVLCLFTLATSTQISLGQSSDDKMPAPLTSDEIRGQISAAAQQDSWFTFVAGPGEFAVVGIVKKNSRDNGAVGVTCKLYDESTRQIISLLAQDGMDEVKRTVTLTKRTQIKMHLETYDNGSPQGGSYRIDLSGALTLQGNSSPETSRGKLL